MESLRIAESTVTDRGVLIDLSVEPEQLCQPNENDYVYTGAAIHGTLQRMTDQFIFQGEVSGTLTRDCDRCLVKASSTITLPVVWVFQENLPMETRSTGHDEHDDDEDDEELDEETDDQNIFPIIGNEIDLAPRIWEELVLAAPVKFVCKPDCAGLCIVCGVNRNEQACSCHPEDDNGQETMKNKGLAGLASLFPDLKPESSKE